MFVPLITQIGKEPLVLFRDGEKYRVTEKYQYSSVGGNFMKYSPTISDIKDFAERVGEGSILYSQKPEDYNRYLEIENLLKQSPSDVQLQKYYVKLAKKLFCYGNESDSIYAHFNRYIDSKFSQIVIDTAYGSDYNLQDKCVVFNDEYLFTDYHKSIIHNREVGKLNTKEVVKAFDNFPNSTTKKIAEITGLSISTVDKIKKLKGISTKGNKKMSTSKTVELFQKSNPNGTQKECSEEIGKSLRTVKTYWKSEIRKKTKGAKTT